MMISKSFDGVVGDYPISKQSKSAVYSILEHEENESPNIPIGPNLLTFYDKVLNLKYLQTLYCHKENTNKLSCEFKANLLAFYLFLTLYMITQMGFSILLYYDGYQTDMQFAFHAACLAVISILAYFMLFALVRSKSFLIHNRIWFSALGMIFLIYLVLSDQRILSGISKIAYENNQLPTTLGVACFISMFRNVVFDCFYLVAFLSIVICTAFLGLSLAYSPLSMHSIFGEFSILCLYLIFQTFDSHQSDYRTRQLFYRRSKEEDQSKAGKKDSKTSEQNNIKTETELLVSACEEIRQDIKSACRVIMYRDVKVKLKHAQTKIEEIKKKIAHGSLFSDVKLEQDLNIDEQDKEFIYQNYMDPGSRISDRTHERKTTMNDILEYVPSFPFQTYGVVELESVLYSVGKN